MAILGHLCITNLGNVYMYLYTYTYRNMCQKISKVLCKFWKTSIDKTALFLTEERFMNVLLSRVRLHFGICVHVCVVDLEKVLINAELIWDNLILHCVQD